MAPCPNRASIPTGGEFPSCDCAGQPRLQRSAVLAVSEGEASLKGQVDTTEGMGRQLGRQWIREVFFPEPGPCHRRLGLGLDSRRLDYGAIIRLFSKHLSSAFYKETTPQDTGESSMSKTLRGGLQETSSLGQTCQCSQRDD